jgi:hypothetical protein
MIPSSRLVLELPASSWSRLAGSVGIRQRAGQGMASISMKDRTPKVAMTLAVVFRQEEKSQK